MAGVWSPGTMPQGQWPSPSLQSVDLAKHQAGTLSTEGRRSHGRSSEGVQDCRRRARSTSRRRVARRGDVGTHIPDVTCKYGPSEYRKHVFILGDQDSVVVTQEKPIDVSEYHTRIVLKPQNVIPEFDIMVGEDE